MTTPPARARPPVALVLGLFFASGACGLVYEIVWMRLLSLTLSVTVYAVTTVLCAFMAGLALGAALGGRLADRLRRPLRAYGVAEVGIALTGILTPVVLFRLGPAYRWMHDLVGGAGTAFALGRFLLAFGVLLVPCTLMGATLPLLSRATIASAGGAGRGAGWLYALNTLGAVAGCAVAGFVLVPAAGLFAASALAAGVNLAVGVLALALDRGAAPVAAARPAEATAPAGARLRLACLALGVSGSTALGYEVLWTRALEQYTHNSTYAYSAMLTVFLLGLALGSAFVAPLVDRLRRPLLVLAGVEIAVGASVIAALRVYARFEDLVPALAVAAGGLGSWGRVVALIFTEAGAALLVTTLLFGATFPLAARLVVEALDSLGARLGAIYTANTIGSILGAVGVGFGLLPALGMRGAFVTLVCVNLALGAGLALAAGGRGRGLAAGAALVVAGAAFALVPPDLFEQSFVRRFGPLLFYREEVTDTVMVTEDAQGERMIRFGDGRGTAGTMTLREDRMYAHLPLLLHPAPRRVLSICFGVGNSLAGIVIHPDVEHVDAVELSPGVVGAAPFFRRTNRDVLAEPRVDLTIADGRNFLLTTDETYDVIRLDPPELHTAGVVNLYTREFYTLARTHLRPGGIFSIWVNVVLTPEEDLRHLVRTVQEVFPHVTVWHGPFLYSWVINASFEPHGPDLAVLLRRIDPPAVRADLAAIGVPDVYALLGHFVFADAGARAFAGAGPLVTDDHTMLDFTVPRSLDSGYGIANANTQNWLVQLMKPGARHDVALETFFRKTARMASYKEPVLPHLTHVEAAGVGPDELRARLAAAPVPHLPRQEGGQSPPAATGTRPAQTS